MENLRSHLSQLANEFAAGVLGALRGASLEEVMAITGTPKSKLVGLLGKNGARGPAAKGGAGKTGRLGRRSDGEIAAVVDRIVVLLERHPKGLRAEEIRQKLNLVAKELPRPIAEALAKRRISRVGKKRATTYFAKKTAKK